MVGQRTGAGSHRRKRPLQSACWRSGGFCFDNIWGADEKLFIRRELLRSILDRSVHTSVHCLKNCCFCKGECLEWKTISDIRALVRG